MKLQATTQKSYYGKATTRTENNAVILKSYNTDVCKIENGKIFRLWAGWSSTTAKHINDFLTQNGFYTHKTTALLTEAEASTLADKLQAERTTACVWYE